MSHKTLFLDIHQIDALMYSFCRPGVLEEFIGKYGVNCFIEEKFRTEKLCRTILSWVVMYSTIVRKINFSSIVKKLIDFGADVNLRNYGFSGTALNVWASESGRYVASDVVGRILLEAGADADTRTKAYYQKTCMIELVSTIYSGRDQSLKIMIEGGASDDVSALLAEFCDVFCEDFRTCSNIVQLAFRIDLIIECA